MYESQEMRDEGTALKPSGRRRKRPARLIAVVTGSLLLVGLILAAGASLAGKASTIRMELETSKQLLTQLKAEIAGDDPEAAIETVNRLKQHTASAREQSAGPLWAAAGIVPWLGPNFQAAGEITASVDDVVRLGAAPLVTEFHSLDWNLVAPKSTGVDLAPLQAAEPKIASAAHAVRASAQRINSIDSSDLVPQLSGPLVELRDQLISTSRSLDAAASAAALLPRMMGSDEPREYLLLIQNNAESRATGGIPGALAVLTIDNGKIGLKAQSSASELGLLAPPLPVPTEQKAIYSGRMGRFIQDVNLTPDFPTTASLAQAMWEKKTSQRVDGVVSIDPVSLSYILGATGPVQVSSPAGPEAGLPVKLTSQNVVATLLSDVYGAIEEPVSQDAYFASVAADIFGALSMGKADPKKLLEAIAQGAQEGRILVWSRDTKEQSLLAPHPLSGYIDGPGISPAQFGVYFNDGTGAKMDYYVTRTAQVVKKCTRDGYQQVTVRIISTNNAPGDAAHSLPPYVTGGGTYGVPAGSVQTNLVAYGPVQANVEVAKVDGQRTNFAPYLHSNRPVGMLSIRLSPGESKTVEFTFGDIVQHTEPNLVVTPTVQPVKEVILPAISEPCG
ncbi:DUF4012 domain-containing protein [Pseudarthrobacter sp. NPDC058362]|uniref:DUF4012 domain-containing protein n=1 Tax=Pseudarthrobacter sp. NPDC058362 TaxID=3346458 RepID=UPI0036535B0C